MLCISQFCICAKDKINKYLILKFHFLTRFTLTVIFQITSCLIKTQESKQQLVLTLMSQAYDFKHHFL